MLNMIKHVVILLSVLSLLVACDPGSIFPPKNKAPTDVTISGSTIEERQPVGATVVTFTVVDPDSADVHTITLVSGFGDNALYSISGNVLKTAAVFDYEQKTSCSLKVRVSDGTDSFEKTFSIAVQNNYDYKATDYFKYSPGYGLKYRVTDESGPLDCSVWAVFQSVPSDSTSEYHEPPRVYRRPHSLRG